MATNPLLLSIREAVRLNKELSRLFDQVGNASKPRGAIVSAYRVALRALRADTSPNAVRDVMRNLRNQVEREARQLLLDASAIGHKSAITQSGYYQQRVTPPPPNLERIEQQVVSIGDQVQAQASAAVGLALMEREEELIVGTDSRAGAVRPTPIVSGLDIALASLLGAAFSSAMGGAQQTDFSKQAIAALDAQTTDCCLRAHGQIVPFDGLFHLTGEPRFADDMDWTPFHWNCRTSVALYKPDYDDGLTDRMRQSADYVIAERRAGRTPDQWPVDAFFEF